MIAVLLHVILIGCLACSIHGFLPSPVSLSRKYSSVATRKVPAALSMTEESSSEWKGAKAISQKDKDIKTIMTIEDISKVLPHRYPFLLVDRVIEFEAGKRAVGIKSITLNEPQFTGHFPNRPIMPGVLMIEAMAQLGGLICLSPPINNDGPGKLFFFTGVNGVRWKSPVTPGDQLIMEMNLVEFNEKVGFAKMSGKSYVGGKVSETDSLVQFFLYFLILFLPLLLPFLVFFVLNSSLFLSMNFRSPWQRTNCTTRNN
jgi:3-hydroxyacyl-[acyl-carrier-protein] dehydratase